MRPTKISVRLDPVSVIKDRAKFLGKPGVCQKSKDGKVGHGELNGLFACNAPLQVAQVFNVSFSSWL